MKLRKLMFGMALAAMPAIMAQSVSDNLAAMQSTAPVEGDSLSVAVGTVLGQYIKGSIQNINSLGGSVNSEVFAQTILKVLQGRSTGFTPEAANTFIENSLHQTRRLDTLSMASQDEFIARMAATEGAVTTPSGLVFIVEREGEGAMPTDADAVSVMYRGQFYDGIVFDETEEPLDLPVRDLTPGFSEGLKMMRPGGRYRIVMPASLGYGSEGIPGIIPGNAALDFTVDLISIKK